MTNQTSSGQAPAVTGSTVDADIAVVGAGIGGLATAVALHRAGFDVHVFERTAMLSEVGGAIVIRKPSERLFHAWGLEGFHDHAVPIDVLEIRDRDGEITTRLDADFVGDGQAYSTHRADIHGLLLGAVPAERIHLGMAATSVTDDDAGQARVSFADGTQVTARLVVGADGIRSVIRPAVSQDHLVFTGLVVLRGMAPASALPTGVTSDRMTMWLEGSKLITILPVRGGTEVAMDTAIIQDLPPEDLWHAEIPTATLLDHFAGFDPGLRTLIASGSVPVRANPVYDREPIKRWARGRVVLVGDAAHPMAPRQGQGANQSIQDAGALADGLSRSGLDDLPGALRFYQEQRVEVATALQRASREAPDVTSGSKVATAAKRARREEAPHP